VIDDPDKPDARVVRELIGRYEDAGRRLSQRVISPPGASDSARAWNQGRAASVLSQVDQEIRRLEREATQWAERSLNDAIKRGVAVADRQARQAGVRDPVLPLRGAFDLVDRGSIEVFARDTLSDLTRAADSMRDQADQALRRMAATGVTNAQVNQILSRGVIEGQPVRAIRELREALRKVHGRRVTIQDKNGRDLSFAVGHYAQMVAVTKTREATRIARHERLKERGIDLVTVIGRNSVNFCTAYLDKVYSLSGQSDRYPPLSDTPGGGPPYHPNCSKGTAPFVAALADPVEAEVGETDPDTDQMLKIEDRTELQRRFEALGLKRQAEARQQRLRRDAGRRARTADTDSPAFLADQIKQLGVEQVDLGRHSDVGAQLVRGLQQVAAAGGTMPRSIVVSEARFIRAETGRPDPNVVGQYLATDGTMRLNPAWPGWKTPESAAEELFEDGVIASSSPLHTVFHEAAHVHHAETGATPGRVPFASSAERSLAERVSIRAAASQDEFLAEVRAARMAGRRLSDDVMELYQRMGGR